MRKGKVTTITLPPDIEEWLAGEIEKRRFSSVSHAAAYALTELKRREESTA